MIDFEKQLTRSTTKTGYDNDDVPAVSAHSQIKRRQQKIATKIQYPESNTSNASSNITVKVIRQKTVEAVRNISTKRNSTTNKKIKKIKQNSRSDLIETDDDIDDDIDYDTDYDTSFKNVIPTCTSTVPMRTTNKKTQKTKAPSSEVNRRIQVAQTSAALSSFVHALFNNTNNTTTMNRAAAVWIKLRGYPKEKGRNVVSVARHLKNATSSTGRNANIEIQERLELTFKEIDSQGSDICA